MAWWEALKGTLVVFVFSWAFILGFLCHVRKEPMVAALWELSIILQETATQKKTKDQF